MSGQTHSYKKKGRAVLKVVITILLFIIFLIWIYNKNQDFLPN